MVNSKLPIVVIACQVFQHLLEKLLPPATNGAITFLDYGLHSVPKKLTAAVQELVDGVERPSLILLGYGLCGNGLDGIQAGAHTLLIPRTDDCIAILLGSYRAYRDEFDGSPATYYLTKGWLELGSNPLQEYEAHKAKYGPETADWVMDQQYRHYKRLAFVAHSDQDLNEYRPTAQRVAEYCARWGMTYEEILGSDVYVRRLVAAAADPEGAGSEFVVVPPGGALRQADFLR